LKKEAKNFCSWGRLAVLGLTPPSQEQKFFGYFFSKK
jgi:hypothetical protein